MKLTDEELSRVLWAHDCGLLRRRGVEWRSDRTPIGGCLFQYVENIPSPLSAMRCASAQCFDWFDECYRRDWTVDTLLRHLEKQGLA